MKINTKIWIWCTVLLTLIGTIGNLKTFFDWLGINVLSIIFFSIIFIANIIYLILTIFITKNNDKDMEQVKSSATWNEL